MDWLTKREAAAYLEVHETTVDRYRKRGILVAKVVRGRVYFERASIFRVADIESAQDEANESNDRGKHLGEFDPDTGDQTKPPDRTRTITLTLRSTVQSRSTPHDGITLKESRP